MFEWLKQRIISWLLSRYVGKWIHVEQKNLHGTTAGNVWTLEAENLLLRTDSLEDLDIPFSVRSGTVKKLSVKWEDKQSLKIHIDTIFVCLETKHSKALSPEMLRAKAHHAKLAELEQWESRLDAGLAVPGAHGEGAVEKSDEAGGSYRAILDKLEVTISNIHLCYYDAASDHTYGAYIDTITLKNMGLDRQDQTCKSADTVGLAAYIDHGQAPEDPDAARNRQHTYVLHPVSAHITVSYDSPKAKLDLTRAKIVVSASVPELCVDLQRKQYLSLVSFANFMSNRKRINVVRVGRPSRPPHNNAAAWWKYVLYTVRSDVHDRMRRRSALFQAERRKKRLEYVDLYLKRRADELSKKEVRLIDALEEEFNFQDIVYFRCTALKKMQQTSQMVVQRKKKTWGEWFKGKPGVDKGKDEEDDSQHGPTPFHNLTKEERESLLSAVGESGVEATYSSLTKSENQAQKLYSLTATLATCRVRLVDVQGKLDAITSFTNASVGVQGSSHAYVLEAGLQSFLVKNTVDNCTILKQATAEEADGEGLMSVCIKQDRGCTPAQTSVKTRVASIDIVFNPNIIGAITAFWALEDPSLDLAIAARYAQDKYADLKGDAAKKLTPGPSKGVCVELDIDIRAPNVFICENSHAELASVLVFRLGHVTVVHQPVDQGEGSEFKHRNRFALGVEHMGIDLLHSVDVQKVLSVGAGKRTCILDNTSLETCLDVTLPLTAADPAIVKADMQGVDIGVTTKSLCDVVKILTSWDKARILFASFSSSPQLTGRVLVKGLVGREEEWCWRWVSLHNSNIVLRKTDDPAAPPDQIMSMDQYFVMKGYEQDIPCISLRRLKDEELSTEEILIFVGRKENDAWLHALRTEQQAVHPFLDYDTLKLPSPEDILEIVNAAPPEAQPRPGSLPLRFTLNVKSVRLVLKQSDKVDLLELKVGGVKTQYELRNGHRALLLIQTMEVNDLQRQAVSSRSQHVLCQDLPTIGQMAALQGKPEAALNFNVTSQLGQVPRARVRMAAMTLRLEPGIVHLLSGVSSQVSQVLKTMDGAPSVSGIEELAASAVDNFLSPRSETSAGSAGRRHAPGAVRSLHEEDVPDVFRSSGGGGKKVVKKIAEFDAAGLTVCLLTKECEDFCKMSMSHVQMIQEDLSMGIFVKGTLGSLAVTDTSAPESVHPDIMSTSHEGIADALVQFQIATFDASTLTSTGVGSAVKVAINRPQIKVLFRFLLETARVVASFSPPAKQPERPSGAQRTPSASPRLTDAGGAPVPALGKRPSETRIEIDLIHPVVIFPRSSRSQEAWVLDLGRIQVSNAAPPGRAPAPAWSISIHDMKLETVSGSAQRRAVAQGVNGTARVNKPEPGGPRVSLAIQLEEVVGCITDAQYALVMGVVSENLTESRVLASDMSEGGGGGEPRTPISLDELAGIISRSVAASSGAGAGVQYDVAIRALRADLVLAKNLDTHPRDTLALVKAEAEGIRIRYELVDSPAEAGQEALLYRCTVAFPELNLTDNRPEMAARALKLLSTDSAAGSGGDCFLMTMSKTKDVHLNLDLRVRQAEAVADAGLLFSILDWLGRGAAAAAQVPAIAGQFKYIVVSPGGFLVSAVLPDARVHFVSSFEDAEADAFILEGTLEIGYAHAFGRLAFSFEAIDIGLMSHRSTSEAPNQFQSAMASGEDEDAFQDPEWEDCRVLGPSTIKFSYKWFIGERFEGVPGEMALSASDCDAQLSHEDVLMMRRVNKVLMRSLDERPAKPAVPAPPPSDAPDRVTLKFEANLSRVSVLLGAFEEAGSLFQVKLLDVVCAGSKTLRGRSDVQGTLGALKVIDESVVESVQREILTVSEEADDLVEFNLTTFDAETAESSGVGTAVKIVINRPQISVLMRFIGELTGYAGSFDEERISMMRTGTVFNSTLRSMSSPLAKPVKKGPVTSFDIDLVHPCLIFPRSSHSKEAYNTDLGRMRVTNRRTDAGATEWDISVHDMKMETVSSTGRRVVLVQKLHGGVKVVMPARPTGFPAQESDAEPGFSVLVQLEEVEGRMSDAQYALLLCIFAENFTEKRFRAQTGGGLFVESLTPNKLEDQGDVLESLARCIEACQKNSANSRLAAFYDVRVKSINLSVGLAPDLNCESMTPMGQAVSSGLHVTYKAMDPMSHDIGHGSDALVWKCVASFADIDVRDRRAGAAAKAKSFLATTALAVPLFDELHLEKGKSPTVVPEAMSPDCFILDFSKTIDQHMGLHITLRKMEGVADGGFFFGILNWIGRGSQATSQIAPAVGKLRYQLVSPGGFLCTVEAPKARIHFVSNFNSSSPDGFITQSTVDCMYAHHDGQLTLRLDLKDFCLTSHAASRPASNANMQIVRPCLVSYTQKWNMPPLDGKQGEGEPPASNNLEMYAQAADFSAMVTYEDVLLGTEVFTTLVKTMAAPQGAQKGAPPPQSPKPPASPAGRSPQVAQSPQRKQAVGGKLGLFGMNITMIFVDDYGGRWIPLLRLGVPNVWIQGTTGSTVLFNSKTRLNLDYFHGSTSTWRAAMDPWDIQVQYMSAQSSDGTHTELHFHSPDDIAMIHISSAVIDSLTSANHTWTQDRRKHAFLSQFEKNRADDDSVSGHTPRDESPSVPSTPTIQEVAKPQFVPYTVHNFLAEELLCILEDGTEYSIQPLGVLELTYEQVWRRRGALQIIARDSNLNSIENSVCLQVGGTAHVFCKVSVEIEQTTSYELRKGDPTGLGPSCPLSLVCDLSQRNGQKVLSVSSMVTIKNCSGVPVHTCVLDPENMSLTELGTVRAGGAMSLPLQYTREGTVCFRAAVEGLEYQWCDAKEEGINLRAVHDGTVSLTQKVDGKFQKFFGDMLPPEARLVGWYTCANDVDGVLRQGVMYVTNHSLCHFSNIMGVERKEVIPLASISTIAKCNTAYVFPNAISITTESKTFYFRTLLNRGEAFRTILNLLPRDTAVKVEDDVDEKARRKFGLATSDIIISVHTCSWHHEPKITDGHVLLTKKHVCFMGNAETPVLIKLPWKQVRSVEKKKSFIVRNNALLIESTHQELFLSSAKWNRDKVLEEEIEPLWKVESGEAASAEFHVDDEGREQKRMEEIDSRCRTITCRLVDKLQTKTAQDPKDPNQLYVRQKTRARDSCRWTVTVLDAITRKRGPDRVAGRPCVIELHPPWVVENLSATPLEFQLVDARQSVVFSGMCEQGELSEVLAISLRREVHLRLRIGHGGSRPASWSTPLLLNTSGTKPEVDAVVELADAEGVVQPVTIEVRRHVETQGFRIRCYNRYWLFNLTGMRLQFKHQVMGEFMPARGMPLGVPLGFNFDQDTIELDLRIDGFDWSGSFKIGQDEVQETFPIKFHASKDGKANPVLPNHQVTIDVSMSTATGRFDRTSIIYFSPQIVVENLLPEPVVVWQRATQQTELGARRPTLWLEPGRVAPLYPEGDRRVCRLSVNYASGDTAKECAAFAPVKKSHEPVLLSCSDGRVVLTETQPLEHGGACLVRFREPTGVLPHKLRNHTTFLLGLKQVGSSQQLLLNVKPGETINMVWPDPLLPKILVLDQIDGKPVPPSNQIDLNNLECPVTGLYPQSQALLVQKILAVSDDPSARPRYALRLALPEDADVSPLPPKVIELTTATVIGREPGNCGCKAVTMDCGVASDIISRQHLRVEPSEEGEEGVWTIVDLESTNGVVVNGHRVLRHRLQHGDTIMIGGAHGVGVGEQPAVAMSPFVYVFETRVGGRDDQEREDASLMQATMVLEEGTKVMHVTVGGLPGWHTDSNGKGNSSVLTLKTRGMSFLLEDDARSNRTREILHMSLEDVHLSMRTDHTHQQITASVMAVQLDNQFDARTFFPVVVNIAPPSKTAIKISTVEKRGHPGVEHYFNHIVFECGNPYVFIEDRLVSILAKFGKSLQDRGQKQGGSSHAKGLHDNATVAEQRQHDKGVPENISRMVVYVVGGKATGDEQAMTLVAQPKGDPYVYVDDLKMRPWDLHLSLMFTGNSDDVRRYVGPVVQRMLRKLRVDDVVVKIPELNKTRMLRTQSSMMQYIGNRYMQSMRKSFFSTKFLLKGLDAWSDSWFGQQAEGQKAGTRKLRRLRAIPEDVDQLSGSFRFDMDGSFAGSDEDPGSRSSRRGSRLGISGAGKAILNDAGGVAVTTAKVGVGVAAKASVGVASTAFAGTSLAAQTGMSAANVAGKGATTILEGAGVVGGAAANAASTAANTLRKGIGKGLGTGLGFFTGKQ